MYRNYVNRQIIIQKNNYFTKLLNNVKHDMKKTWSILNNLMKPNAYKANTQIDKILFNDQIIDNNEDICNLFNSHFATIGSRVAN